jgi:arsenite methyltransferase
MNGNLVYDQDLSQKQGEVALCADMVGQRRRMMALLQLAPGESVLEIGSGNGMMAHDMALAVGELGNITGLDISGAMVTMARGHCAGLPNVTFVEADAVTLPFADRSFDVVTITQCLCLVADIDAAVGELARVLKPGGRAVILETDWDTLVWNSTKPDLMDKIMRLYKDAYVDARLPRRLGRLLKSAGIEVTGHDQFAMLNWSFERDSYSGHQVAFVKEMMNASDAVTGAELADWEQGIMAMAQADEYFFSLNRYIFICSKG